MAPSRKETAAPPGVENPRLSRTKPAEAGCGEVRAFLLPGRGHANFRLPRSLRPLPGRNDRAPLAAMSGSHPTYASCKSSYPTHRGSDSARAQVPGSAQGVCGQGQRSCAVPGSGAGPYSRTNSALRSRRSARRFRPPRAACAALGTCPAVTLIAMTYDHEHGHEGVPIRTRACGLNGSPIWFRQRARGRADPHEGVRTERFLS